MTALVVLGSEEFADREDAEALCAWVREVVHKRAEELGVVEIVTNDNRGPALWVRGLAKALRPVVVWHLDGRVVAVRRPGGERHERAHRAAAWGSSDERDIEMCDAHAGSVCIVFAMAEGAGVARSPCMLETRGRVVRDHLKEGVT